MDEHKYEVIDTSGSDYGQNDNDWKKGKKKKMSKGVRALIAILLVFVIVIGTGSAVVYLYLDKMNYGDSVGEVDPNLDADEALSFDNQSDADKDIRANLDDNQIWYDDRVYNILLVGVDYGDEEKVMFEGAYLPRSDSMILISINSVTNTINMVSLSRAVYVAIPGHGNKRLNTAHAYGGATMLVDTIEQNYKIRIDKYITVDISGFTDIIDILGGVQIEMTAAEAKYVLGKNQAGTYNLNGKQATSYSRLRSIDSDRKRTGRQRAVLNAIVNKFRKSSVSTMLGLLDDVLPLVTTNFTKTELISQVSNAPKYLAMSINEDIIPHNATNLTMRDGKEVLILNWDETKKYVHDLLYPDMIPQSLEGTTDK
ncbi:MAG: LCP family protein [Clostridia bacterium]|nr:LCP family protein [Clostridia bacterium]